MCVIAEHEGHVGNLARLARLYGVLDLRHAVHDRVERGALLLDDVADMEGVGGAHAPQHVGLLIATERLREVGPGGAAGARLDKGRECADAALCDAGAERWILGKGLDEVVDDVATRRPTKDGHFLRVAAEALDIGLDPGKSFAMVPAAGVAVLERNLGRVGKTKDCSLGVSGLCKAL